MCHYCNGALTDSDRFRFLMAKAQWSEGQELPDEWRWLGDGGIVPVCRACFEEMERKPEGPYQAGEVFDDAYATVQFVGIALLIAVAAGIAVWAAFY